MINFDVQGALFPNPFTMLVQLLSTAILFWAVKKFLWGPARQIMKARSEKMQADLSNADLALKEANAQLTEAKGELTKAYQTSLDIVNSAKNEATQLKEDIIAEAKKEAQSKLDEVERRIELQQREVQSQLHDEIVSVAMAAVAKLVEGKATTEDDNAAINKFVEEIKKDRV